MRVGEIAIDDTGIRTNASRDRNRSYESMQGRDHAGCKNSDVRVGFEGVWITADVGPGSLSDNAQAAADTFKTWFQRTPCDAGVLVFLWVRPERRAVR